MRYDDDGVWCAGTIGMGKIDAGRHGTVSPHSLCVGKTKTQIAKCVCSKRKRERASRALLLAHMLMPKAHHVFSFFTFLSHIGRLSVEGMSQVTAWGCLATVTVYCRKGEVGKKAKQAKHGSGMGEKDMSARKLAKEACSHEHTMAAAL